MKVGPQPSGLLTRRKILSASAKAFLENGYAGTSSKMVAQLAGVANGSPFYLYGNKEGVLLELVKQMFSYQFEAAEGIPGADRHPLLIYAAETSLQLHITELSAPLRELYVTAYTLPSTLAYINQRMAGELKTLFSHFLPDAADQDFYEMELASAGIMRSFMAEPCSEVFPIDRKIRRFLDFCYRLYRVPYETYAPVIEQAVQMDMLPLAPVPPLTRPFTRPRRATRRQCPAAFPKRNKHFDTQSAKRLSLGIFSFCAAAPFPFSENVKNFHRRIAKKLCHNHTHSREFTP